jgi:hypothetical protein
MSVPRASVGGRRTARRFWRPRTSAVVEDRTSLVGHSWVTPYLLSGPSIVMVSLLLAFPVIYAVWGSLFDAEFLGGEEEFVGVQHYVNLFQDPDFLWTIARSLIFLSGCLVQPAICASSGESRSCRIWSRAWPLP